MTGGPVLEVLHRRLDAAGIRTTTARDALLAAVVAVGSLLLFWAVMRAVLTDLGAAIGVDVSADHMTTGQYVGAGAVIVAQASALTLRRRAPLLCLGLTLVGQLGLVLLLPPFVNFQAPAGVVAAYTLGAYAPRRTAIWSAGGTAVVQVLLGLVLAGPDTSLGFSVGAQLSSGLVSALLTYLGAVLVGAYVGTRRELLAGLREQVLQAEREQEALAAQAVLEERGRMARELHDVAAHHLSGIVLQASAAERLVDRDPDRAKESMRWIRAQGRETLDNLRLVVGILRDATAPDDGVPATPQPTLDDVPELVELARSAGATVRETSRGEPVDLPPTVQLTVYRVLQEALSNARRHAPGRTVEIDTEHGARALVVTVHNGGPTTTTVPSAAAARPGHGLIGMRERAEFVGGTLDAGPAPGGGWRVRLTVPRTASAPAPSRPAPAPAPSRSASASAPVPGEAAEGAR
ncbi:sensor histidine kinase [Isoptericola sp. NEAU-Y5]|uniref:histidine kinase n=1 Tax=Isoptericola luteus TaxID=2879484 RepID=A0ABS7ZAH0_9MICO|nr:sensor histidine kinase [Isoptericola sp. NEAU-Y5]MCA5892058.1 sensor histidine kinase [Isoptericola sp. NEAU-Y5]